jgi:hypothetical protein
MSFFFFVVDVEVYRPKGAAVDFQAKGAESAAVG